MHQDFCHLLQKAIQAAPEGVKELLEAIWDEHCRKPVATADSGGHGGSGDPPGN
jgi:hypothetical protein